MTAAGALWLAAILCHVVVLCSFIVLGRRAGRAHARVMALLDENERLRRRLFELERGPDTYRSGAPLPGAPLPALPEPFLGRLRCNRCDGVGRVAAARLDPKLRGDPIYGIAPVRCPGCDGSGYVSRPREPGRGKDHSS